MRLTLHIDLQQPMHLLSALERWLTTAVRVESRVRSVVIGATPRMTGTRLLAVSAMAVLLSALVVRWSDVQLSAQLYRQYVSTLHWLPLCDPDEYGRCDWAGRSEAAFVTPSLSSMPFCRHSPAVRAAIRSEIATTQRAVQHALRDSVTIHAEQLKAFRANATRSAAAPDSDSERPQDAEWRAVLSRRLSNDSFASVRYKSYSGSVFARLRQLSGVGDEAFVSSLAGAPYTDWIANSASRSFFFFSQDRRYMVKCITVEELRFLTARLQDYYQHLRAHRDSLLIRVFGLYRITGATGSSSRLYAMVMQNILYSQHRIHRRFDIKGSSHVRQARPGERQQSTPVLKDVDFLPGCSTRRW